MLSSRRLPLLTLGWQTWAFLVATLLAVVILGAAVLVW